MRSQMRWRRSFGRGPLAALAQTMTLALLALLALAGCSASGGGSGINVTLGLQGSTADNPAPPPKLASAGPDHTYAFVYDNQVWAHVKGASGLMQVTRLTLSAGATIEWGPLVWSPSGKSLAFALVQNLATDQLIRDAGQIYYVNVSSCLSSSGANCLVYNTEITGSVYGHTYDWLNDDWLIAGGGSGIAAYDVSDPNGWRTWQLRMTANDTRDYNCGPSRSYGDVEVVGTTLYYTCMTIANPGATGAVGTASLNSLSLYNIASNFSLDPVTRDENIASALNGNQGLYGSQLLSLGNVYADPNGQFETGAWTVSGNNLAYEQIGKVDTQTSVAARTLCLTTIYNLGCDSTHIGGVTSQPLSAHPQIALGPNGAVAYQGDKLYLSGQSSGIAVTSPYAPVWLSDSSALATNVTATTTDASGVTRTAANLVIAQGGSPATLIAGASDAALS